MTDSTSGRAPSTSPRSEVVRRETLPRRERDQMFALYATYFVTRDRMVFERDLAEKEWVVLLRDVDGCIDGFSTLLSMRVGDATIFFSGDTIVARHRWGSFDLPRLWGRHVFSIAGANAWWFLISSGFRTYRYLPLFFRRFHPVFDADTPPEIKVLLDTIAERKFGSAYDRVSGVIRLLTPAPLVEGLSDPSARAARDPHVGFFVKANPGHAAGDELACLVSVTEENLTPAGLRMLGRR